MNVVFRGLFSWKWKWFSNLFPVAILFRYVRDDACNCPDANAHVDVILFNNHNSLIVSRWTYYYMMCLCRLLSSKYINLLCGLYVPWWKFGIPSNGIANYIALLFGYVQLVRIEIECSYISMLSILKSGLLCWV